MVNERNNTRQEDVPEEQKVHGVGCTCNNDCDNDSCACKSGKVCQCRSNTDDDVRELVSPSRILFWV